MLKAAAATFEIHAQPESEGRTLLSIKASKIFTPLKSSLILLDDGAQRYALLTSHFMTHYYHTSNLLRKRVADALNIPFENTAVFSSHNHCTVKLIDQQYSFGQDLHDLLTDESQLTAEGREMLEQYVSLAQTLPSQLQEVTVHHGRGHERRISHNRKGRKADGDTYLMRETDRLLLGEDFNGDIDDDAFVVGFFNKQHKPVCFLTQFTAHPVTAYHCDHPVVHGEFPQIACDDLSAAWGNVPVAFLQGCAGDTNSKGLLSTKSAEENAADATRYGHMLGETFINIAKNLTPSPDTTLAMCWQWSQVPFKPVPPRDELEQRLEDANAFLARCDAGDTENTLFCDGLNFPVNMTVKYRKALIEPVKKWLQWAISFHTRNRLEEAPTSVGLHMAAMRIGPVGIVGMPCEPLLGIGRQIKRDSPMAMTIPCGYMNDTSYAYIPDGPNCDDDEYMAQFCRYTTTLLPYKKPAGDVLAHTAVDMLNQLNAKASS